VSDNKSDLSTSNLAEKVRHRVSKLFQDVFHATAIYLLCSSGAAFWHLPFPEAAGILAVGLYFSAMWIHSERGPE
jgi:hypothetical protein